ncbi:hypothetical protein [Methanolobus halotolerans]|uniref:Uncharacterized protein n=1 Tax=Methanolobus halotolerans TaxID=2052935 RepID=A0A4E0QQN2_9EURY|nr:hypothetical protein [Methanolobus halotolerans]TGC08056.1 hypothetical protein CUN85_10495 [Methanolobus halotolerans]
MKLEKKQRILRNQKYRNIRSRNRKINRINLLILAAGLLLLFLGQYQVASILIWTGVAISLYTILASILARRSKM